MLRRTWASQVEPVYREFIRHYPDISSLANAEHETVKHLMLSLGLPKRADDICAMGRELLNDFAGEVPKNRDELRKLTGVGEYVAGAVSSMAFNQPEWIVDTNVVRVFIRFLGLSIKGEARKSAQIIALAKEYACTKMPRKANYALLDHAALICKSFKPECQKCPVKQRCSYAITNEIIFD
jgi:A/G-specific adenine glycosylase